MKNKIQNILLLKEFIMDATVKTIFDEMFKVVESNLFASDFDETCDKIADLARTLWFEHKVLTFEEMSDIKHKVFEIRSRRMDEENKIECERMHVEFEKSCEKMHEQSSASKPSSNNSWWIMEQNRINDMMNQQMIQNTIIQNQIINSMM